VPETSVPASEKILEARKTRRGGIVHDISFGRPGGKGMLYSAA
jgi:hypothetical protein